MDEIKTNRFTTQLTHNYMELRVFPDSVLREVAQPVYTFDLALQRFANHMFAFMKEHRGIGLAAPQVGVLHRIIVVASEDIVQCLINPEILASSTDYHQEEEGCLSLPEQWFDVDRYLKVEVRARSPEGRKLQFEASDWNARVLQHEIDHLNGILICDRGVEINMTI